MTEDSKIEEGRERLQGKPRTVLRRSIYNGESSGTKLNLECEPFGQCEPEI